MTAPTRIAPVRALDPERLSRVEAILSRYPDATEAEVAEVVQFLRKGPILDRGLLSSNVAVGDQLEQFEHDQRSTLRLQMSDYLLLLALAAATLTGIVLLHA